MQKLHRRSGCTTDFPNTCFQTQTSLQPAATFPIHLEDILNTPSKYFHNRGCFWKNSILPISDTNYFPFPKNMSLSPRLFSFPQNYFPFHKIIFISPKLFSFPQNYITFPKIISLSPKLIYFTYILNNKIWGCKPYCFPIEYRFPNSKSKYRFPNSKYGCSKSTCRSTSSI